MFLERRAEWTPVERAIMKQDQFFHSNPVLENFWQKTDSFWFCACLFMLWNGNNPENFLVSMGKLEFLFEQKKMGRLFTYYLFDIEWNASNLKTKVF